MPGPAILTGGGPSDSLADDEPVYTWALQQGGHYPLNVLKVGSRSDPNKVAGALAGTIRESHRAEIQTIGAGALNQAIKAIAIARGYLAPAGLDVWCYPAFVDVEIDGTERTAIKLFVEPRHPPR